MTDTPNECANARRRVIFHGRVQGVCFRATTAELARGFKITGIVRNLPDGTVELEAQGTLAEIDRFLAAIGGEFASNIANADISDAPTRADETGFRIAY